jgi:HEAT repeat protein
MRSRAAEALGKIGSDVADAAPALIDAPGDKEKEVLKSAAQALKGIQGKKIS